MADRVTATTGDLLAVIKSFHAMSAAFDEELEATHYDVARLIATAAVAQAQASGHPGTIKAAETITAKRSNRAALVSQGKGGTSKNAGEWELGALFGAFHNEDRVSPAGRKFHGYNQFPIARPGGYSVYPAIDAEAERTTQIYSVAVGKIIDKQFAK